MQRVRVIWLCWSYGKYFTNIPRGQGNGTELFRL